MILVKSILNYGSIGSARDVKKEGVFEFISEKRLYPHEDIEMIDTEGNSLALIRSSASYVSRGYPRVYTELIYDGFRCGVVFKPKEAPDIFCPFDLLKLSVVTSNNSTPYLGDTIHLLLPGYDKFVFHSLADMLKKYPTSVSARRAYAKWINDFNYERGSPISVGCKTYYYQEALGPTNPPFRPSANEVAFLREVEIEPLAIFAWDPNFFEDIGLPVSKSVLKIVESFG